MNFELIFYGTIPSKNRARSKRTNEIREELSSQVKNLWARKPLIGLIKDGAIPEDCRVMRGSRQYICFIKNSLGLSARVSITYYLQISKSGSVGDADIDNKTKAICDALTVPLRGVANEDAQAASCFCIFEDDSLIHSLQLTRRLMLSNSNDEKDLTIVRIETTPTETQIRTIGLIGVEVY